MTARVAVAGFQHETNTFAPLPTRFEDFRDGGAWPPLTEGPEVLRVFQNLNIPISGFLRAALGAEFGSDPAAELRSDFRSDFGSDLGSDLGLEVVPILWTSAEPGGTVEDAAFDRITGMICDSLGTADRLDAVYLDLHGAMVTESHQDGEAEILRRVRELVGPELPVVVSLDLHGNLSPAFFERASAVAIYRTYPHVDMAETGARAALLLRTLLDRGRPFARAYRQAPFMTPITDQSTMREPGRSLYAALPGLEGEGVTSVDFAFGFPPADIYDCGPAVFAYGTDQAAVDAAADRFMAELAAAEERFANPLVPAADAVAEAMCSTGPRPVVICDPQDNPGAGAVGDSTGLLRALLDAGAEGAAIGMIWDPETATEAHRAGQGAEIDVSIGGKFPDVGGPPVTGRAKVEALSDGTFTFTGPMYGGATAHLGPMAALRLGGVRVVVGARRCQNADQEIFRAVGIEPAGQRIVAVKSAVHFLADYEPIAERVIFAAAPGANACDLPQIPYTRLRPGIRLGARGPAFSPPREVRA